MTDNFWSEELGSTDAPAGRDGLGASVPEAILTELVESFGIPRAAASGWTKAEAVHQLARQYCRQV